MLFTCLSVSAATQFLSSAGPLWCHVPSSSADNRRTRGLASHPPQTPTEGGAAEGKGAYPDPRYRGRSDLSVYQQ